MASWRVSRPRSRSSSAKSRSDLTTERTLDSRWGDAAITAPNQGGWNQSVVSQYNNTREQTISRPPSRTSHRSSIHSTSDDDSLLDQHSDSTTESRRKITITIPLPWSKKQSSRSQSLPRHQTSEYSWYCDASPVTAAPPALDEDRSISTDLTTMPPERQSSPFEKDYPYMATRLIRHHSQNLTRSINGHDSDPIRSRATTPLQRKPSPPKASLSSTTAFTILSPVKEDFNRISPTIPYFQSSSSSCASSTDMPLRQRYSPVASDVSLRQRSAPRARSLSRGRLPTQQITNPSSRRAHSSSRPRDIETIITPTYSTTSPISDSSLSPALSDCSTDSSKSTVSSSSSISHSSSQHKQRYGNAGAGPHGFYHGVVNDYVGIGKVVVEDSTSEHIDLPTTMDHRHKNVDTKLHVVDASSLHRLVPSDEELWG